MPQRPGSSTLRLGASAFALVAVLCALGARSLGFGYAFGDWELWAGTVGQGIATGTLRVVHFAAAALVALLAFGLLHALTRSGWAALAGGLVLATTPTLNTLATELSARDGLCFTAATVAMFASWARFRLAGRTASWVCALCAFALAAPQGGAAFVLLPLLLVFDLVLFTGASRSLRLDFGEVFRQKWRYLPFALIALASPVVERPVPLAVSGDVLAWLPAALGGGLACCAALAGRSVAECFREVRLALFGAAALAIAVLPSQVAVATSIAVVAIAVLWASAGLALVRAGGGRLVRVTTFSSTLGALLALQVALVQRDMTERVRQDQLAHEVVAATRQVLPRLVEPLARGQRIRTEFAPVDEQTLRAMVAALARVPDPGVRSLDPCSAVVLRWQGAQGWRLY